MSKVIKDQNLEAGFYGFALKTIKTNWKFHKRTDNHPDVTSGLYGEGSHPPNQKLSTPLDGTNP